ncbi:ZIP family metal transporter [Vandammella animalimorsus]|uniref:ZIP family metal transporter n=1 Tax=Vandammella animalimorsus TaxID=2029117 RepID=A0A2A2T5A7_9BURK|nr:ZIP family metal transporter [Vandammella animalimorsus]PAX16730.1 ZIP family metal transporter [Vandammella animalimorsus]PAX19364.1 ZIP family metal transporter [Vandammella animalimorsus]
MTLGQILLATLLAGVGSVWLAALLIRLGVMAQGARVQGHHLLSFAAGSLLATAFVHLLPEAMESPSADLHTLFTVLLAGLVAFFLLDKAELWHHGHEHHAHAGHGAPSHHSHSHPHLPGAARQRQPGGWSILAGDSVHCFGDGVLIASAFLVDWRVGLLAAFSVLAHEVPHHIGDLIVLAEHSEGPAAQRHRAARIKVSVAGSMTALGGLMGYGLLGLLDAQWLPYLLVVAASSFIYVALADLVPQLQLQLTARQTALQVSWLLAGMLLVAVVSHVLHAGHEHEHEHGAHGGHDHAGHRHAHEEPPAELGSFRQHPLHLDRLRPPPGSK